VIDDPLFLAGGEAPAEGCAGAELAYAVHLAENFGVGGGLVFKVNAIDGPIEPRAGVADEVVVADVLEVLEVVVHAADRLRDVVDNGFTSLFLDVGQFRRIANGEKDYTRSVFFDPFPEGIHEAYGIEIGRASCRERV